MTATSTTATGQHLAEYRLYIDGEQQSANSGRIYQKTIDPFTGKACAVVVKRSDPTPVSALEPASLVGEAGFSPGMVNPGTPG